MYCNKSLRNPKFTGQSNKLSLIGGHNPLTAGPANAAIGRPKIAGNPKAAIGTAAARGMAATGT